MRGACFDGGSHVVSHNDDQDLGEDQVEQAKFFAQFGAVGLDCGLGRLDGRVIGGCQVAL